MLVYFDDELTTSKVERDKIAKSESRLTLESPKKGKIRFKMILLKAFPDED